MTHLNLHGVKVETVFHLLGSDENALTKSLGWCLSQVPSFLDQLGSALGTPELSVRNTIVRLQEHKAAGGITDLEIHAPGYTAWIIEAKKGFKVPSTDQLAKYAKRLEEPKCRHAQHRGLVVLAESDRSDQWLRERLPDEIAGFPVHALSWRKVQAMAGQARRSARVANRNLLEQFQIYLGLEVAMRNWYDNWVYVVALNRETFGGTTTFVDAVEKHRKYFHPADRRGYPVDPPNYLAFRYDGHLQSIHHVEGFQVVKDVEPYFPEQPSEEWGKVRLYDLGKPFGPCKPIRVGARLQAAPRWCFINTLLTCDTVKEAVEATKKREKLIRSGCNG